MSFSGEISLSLALPPGFEPLGHAAFADLLKAQVRQVEILAAQRRAQTCTAVLGMKAVLKQRVGDRPSSREPRRRLSPRVACRNTWRRIEALARNRHFLLAYSTVLSVWRAPSPTERRAICQSRRL
jgi:hypothetical protein